MAIRVFIVEDHPAVLRGYKLLINREPDMEVCGTAASIDEAVTLIPDCHPEFVILDLSLNGTNSLPLIHHLYQTYPVLPILIVSGYERYVYRKRNFDTLPPNMKGYLQKEEVPERLVATIRQLLAS